MINSIIFSGGSGRTDWSTKSKPVVGNVILHDKLKYWQRGDHSVHYHQGEYITLYCIYYCS